VAALDLGQNALNGTLSAALAQLTNASIIGLAVYDNLLSGTIPPAYSAFSWIAVAYNPLLVGALPSGMVSNTVNKLQAWATYVGGFYSYTWNSGNVYTTYIQAPTYSTGYLFGTSIGLDRPLAAILMDLKAAMDPGGTVLTGWNSTTMQFCPPYLAHSIPGQQASLPGYGRWLTGLFKPSAAGALSGTSYCLDYGITPPVPHIYTANGAVTPLGNPLGSATAGSSTLPQNAALTGGVSAVSMMALGLTGTMPLALRELRTARNVFVSRNLLTGSLPSAWGQVVTWTNFPSSCGFDSCLILDVGQNALTGTLPAGVASISSKLGMGLHDNAFSGTLPAAYTALSWVSVAYNPALVGTLPTGFTSLKLFAWTEWSGAPGFVSMSFAFANAPQYGFGPSANNGGYGTVRTRYGYRARLRFANRAIHSAVRQGYLYGTSIGLDRPLASILLDIKAALDPSGAVLSSWNASHLQPCRPWSYNTGAASQNAASPVAGKAWKYISVDTANEYCQDMHAPNYLVYVSASATFTNTARAGGIAGLWLSGLSLNGTLPAALQDLRTASLITLSRNALTGSIPSAWCVGIQRARFCAFA
jgi:hypothetical protein